MKKQDQIKDFMKCLIIDLKTAKKPIKINQEFMEDLNSKEQAEVIYDLYRHDLLLESKKDFIFLEETNKQESKKIINRIEEATGKKPNSKIKKAIAIILATIGAAAAWKFGKNVINALKAGKKYVRVPNPKQITYIPGKATSIIYL